MNSFYGFEELKTLGLKSFGKNVLISKKCSIYGAENISLGNNVRIDDFCILSGNIEIKDYVHISAYCALYGKFGIKIGNFCTISAKSIIFSATDDFSGEFMVSPMVPEELTNIQGGETILKDFVQLGANTVVMPSVICKEGSATGAFSLVLKDLSEWSINFGIPAKFYKERKKEVIRLSEKIG